MGGSLVVWRRGSGERQVYLRLSTAWERLRGLLGTTCDARQVALVGCSSIHTWGMRYRLDVACVARDGTVLGVWRALPPQRLAGCRAAWVVLERPHKRGPWLVPGEVVEMTMEEGVEDGDEIQGE